MSQISTLYILLLLYAENQLEEEEDAKGRCLMARVKLNNLLAVGMGLKNNNGGNLSFTGYPVSELQNEMQASGSCLNSPEDDTKTVCIWDPRIDGVLYQQTVGICLTGINLTTIQDH